MILKFLLRLDPRLFKQGLRSGSSIRHRIELGSMWRDPLADMANHLKWNLDILTLIGYIGKSMSASRSSLLLLILFPAFSSLIAGMIA